jgi:hypothetical protein
VAYSSGGADCRGVAVDLSGIDISLSQTENAERAARGGRGIDAPCANKLPIEPNKQVVEQMDCFGPAYSALSVRCRYIVSGHKL